MAVGLLWVALALLLLMLALRIISEFVKRENKARVLLVFLENSEEICEGTLRHLCCEARRGRGWEQIVVIDNYSTDDSPAIVNRLRRYYPEIDLLIRREREASDYRRIEMLCRTEFRVIDLRDFTFSPCLVP